MARTKATFTQGDISRALKAARSAGFEVGAIELRPDGVMQIKRATSDVSSTTPSPFEIWKAKRDAREA